MTYGNYLADYKVCYPTCPLCGGSGTIHAKDNLKQQISDMINDFYLENDFGAIKYTWKELKEQGQCKCWYCGGDGKIEIWR